MDKIISWLKTAWAALIAAPVIAPVLDLLHHRSVLVLIAGFIGYSLIPQIQGLPPMWRDNLGTFVFIGVLLLSGRFTLEGILEAKAGLPKTTEEYLRDLLKELISPTPDATVAVGSTSADVQVTATNYKLVRGTGTAAVVTPRPTLPVDQQADKG